MTTAAHRGELVLIGSTEVEKKESNSFYQTKPKKFNTVHGKDKREKLPLNVKIPATSVSTKSPVPVFLLIHSSNNLGFPHNDNIIEHRKARYLLGWVTSIFWFNKSMEFAIIKNSLEDTGKENSTMVCLINRL